MANAAEQSGLVVPTIDNAIFAELIQSFSDGLDQRGFTMLIARRMASIWIASTRCCAN